jgi:membrane-associated phospholipid phosphatase
MQLALALLTGHLRVRAGMHYPTDVLVGTVVGAAVGLGVPLAQQVEVSIQPDEILGMGLGASLGFAAGFLFPKRIAPLALRFPVSVSPLSSGGYLLELRGKF